MVSSTISLLKFFVLLSMALDIVLTAELEKGPLNGQSPIVQCTSRGYYGACRLPPGSNFCRTLICASYLHGEIVKADRFRPPAYKTPCGTGRYCNTTDSCLPESSEIVTSEMVDSNGTWLECNGIDKNETIL